MVKVLVVGSIDHNFSLLEKKLAALQSSSHGPFQALLCVGAFCSSEEEFSSCVAALRLPLPTFVLDPSFLPGDAGELPSNLFVMSPYGVRDVVGLSVASARRGGGERQWEGGCHKDGCDVLVTEEWPEGVSSGAVPPSAPLPPGGRSAGVMACRLKPRYHFTASNSFYQRTPYTNCGPGSSLTRFISLAPVSASKDKSLKWIHALALDPIASSLDAPTPPTGSFTLCPYVSLSASSTGHSSQPPLPPNPPPPNVNKKRKLEETVMGKEGDSQVNGAFFFGAMGVPREQGSGGGGGGDTGRQQKQKYIQPPSEDSKTLFVGGLTQRVTEKDVVRNLAGAVSVHIPSGKNFAFVEFDSPETARAVVIESLSTMGVSIGSRPVTIGWAAGGRSASSGGGGGGAGGSIAASVINKPPSAAACTLFIGGLPVSGNGSGDDDIKDQLELSLLGLFPGAVRVNQLAGKTYAFLDFKSHEVANGIIKQYEENNSHFTLPVAGGEGRALSVGWAQGKAQRRSGEGSGREYDNSASHNADCWFCLASSAVKIHLIVSVGEGFYLSLPRGGVADWHVLLIPVECVSTRSQLSPAAINDLVSYQTALEGMFHSQNLACMRFERAIRTQGRRNHMQVHVVPLSQEQVEGAVERFLSLAGDHNIHFHEILDSQLSIEEFLVNLPGGPYSEYFCIEIPYGELQRSRYRRFLFVRPEDERGSKLRFPMNFGTEVAATLIGQPDRANWKNCVQHEVEETRLAERFRSAFQPFEPAPSTV